MIWYQAVELALDAPSAYAVELILQPETVENEDYVVRPRTWDGYRDGDHAPNLAKVCLAESHAPGTAKWFGGPIYYAFQGKLTNYFDIDEYLSAHPQIGPIIYPREEFIADLPIRELKFSAISDCMMLDGMDLLEAIVLLLESGILSRDRRRTDIALKLYVDACPKITEIPQLRFDFTRMFDMIESRYAPTVRMNWDDFVPPWYVRMPDLEDPMISISDLRSETLAQTTSVKE